MSCRRVDEMVLVRVMVSNKVEEGDIKHYIWRKEASVCDGKFQWRPKKI